MLHKSIITGIALSVFASSYPLYCGSSGLDQDQCPSLELVISRQSISMPLALRNIEITHKDNKFYVDDMPIANHRLDKELRNISTDKLSKILTANAYLHVNKSQNNEEYAIALQHRLQGGGIFGANAGAWLGVVGTKVIGHGILYLVSCGAGPGQPAALIALEATFGPAITAASVKVGIGMGVLGAVASGPV